MALMNRLNARAVATLGASRYNDGTGLLLHKRKDGGAQRIYRYTLHERRHEMGLGALRNISLKQAHECAMQWRSVLREGRDPIEVQSTFVQLYKSSSFIEDYSRWKRPLSSCYVLSRQSSTFFSPRAYHNNPPSQAQLNAFAQGNCKDSYAVQTLYNFRTCMNSISDLGGLASPVAPKIPIINGKNPLVQTVSDALKKTSLLPFVYKMFLGHPRFFPPPGLFQ